MKGNNGVRFPPEPVPPPHMLTHIIPPRGKTLDRARKTACTTLLGTPPGLENHVYVRR